MFSSAFPLVSIIPLRLHHTKLRCSKKASLKRGNKGYACLFPSMMRNTFEMEQNASPGTCSLRLHALATTQPSRIPGAALVPLRPRSPSRWLVDTSAPHYYIRSTGVVTCKYVLHRHRIPCHPCAVHRFAHSRCRNVYSHLCLDPLVNLYSELAAPSRGTLETAARPRELWKWGPANCGRWCDSF